MLAARNAVLSYFKRGKHIVLQAMSKKRSNAQQIAFLPFQFLLRRVYQIGKLFAEVSQAML